MTSPAIAAHPLFHVVQRDPQALYALGIHHRQDNTPEGHNKARDYMTCAALIHATPQAFRTLGAWYNEEGNTQEAAAHYSIAEKLGCKESSLKAQLLLSTLSPAEAHNVQHRVNGLVGAEGSPIHEAIKVKSTVMPLVREHTPPSAAPF